MPTGKIDKKGLKAYLQEEFSLKQRHIVFLNIVYSFLREDPLRVFPELPSLALRVGVAHHEVLIYALLYHVELYLLRVPILRDHPQDRFFQRWLQIIESVFPI